MDCNHNLPQGVPAGKGEAMKPHRFKQGNSWGWIHGLHPNGCIDFNFACTSLPAIREGAMRESGVHEEINDKMTKDQLLACAKRLQSEKRETGERSERRGRVIRELGYVIDEMDQIDPLPHHILWVVTKHMQGLVREGLSHTKPGA